MTSMKRLLSVGIFCLVLVGCDEKSGTPKPQLPPVPAVSSIEPAYGRAGEEIMISGTNFGDKAGDVKVTFGNDKNATILDFSDSTITVRAPAGSKSGAITITVGDHVAGTPVFAFYSLYMFGATKDVKYEATVWKDGDPTRYSAKRSQVVEGVVVGTDVHAIGYEYNDALTESQQVYWKNGVSVPVSGTTPLTRFVGIAVSGSDVYIAGYEINVGSRGTPLYWKNGERFVLADGEYSEFSGVTDILVDGSDVYVTGDATDEYAMQPCYWKNGVLVTLDNGPGTVTSIAIVGSDVYATSDEFYPWGTSAIFWKNDVRTTLKEPIDGEYYYNTNSILVSGSDVYVGGSQNDNPSIWKNGVEQILESPVDPYGLPLPVRQMSIYRGNIFMTLSAYTFNSYSYVYKGDEPIFSSNEFRQLVLSHQVVEY